MATLYLDGLSIDQGIGYLLPPALEVVPEGTP